MKISDVSERYGVSVDTLRYYERAGLLRHVPRNAAGVRDFDERACNAVEFVLCMRRTGMSIEALAEYMDLLEVGPETIEARKRLLIDQREAISKQIGQLQAGKDLLDWKIEHYDEVVRRFEEGFGDE